MRTSLRDSRGFTLIELMVAMLVTMVGIVGLIQAMSFATEQNLRTQRRDEAVQVGEEWMTRFRATPFAMISTCPTCPGARYQYSPRSVTSRVRSGGTYRVVRSTVLAADGGTMDLGVQVAWRYKNFSTSHEVHSVISQ